VPEQGSLNQYQFFRLYDLLRDRAKKHLAVNVLVDFESFRDRFNQRAVPFHREKVFGLSGFRHARVQVVRLSGSC
jgi:hypothetical protein